MLSDGNVRECFKLLTDREEVTSESLIYSISTSCETLNTVCRPATNHVRRHHVQDHNQPTRRPIKLTPPSIAVTPVKTMTPP